MPQTKVIFVYLKVFIQFPFNLPSPWSFLPIDLIASFAYQNSFVLKSLNKPQRQACFKQGIFPLAEVRVFPEGNC